MKESTKNRLKALSEGPCAILLINDHSGTTEAIKTILEQVFSEGEIKILNADEYLNIDAVIEQHRFDLVLIDGSLGTWPSHPTYGSVGYNAIPFIRQHYPDAVIVSISTNDQLNQQAEKRGATDSLSKEWIHDLTKL